MGKASPSTSPLAAPKRVTRLISRVWKGRRRISCHLRADLDAGQSVNLTSCMDQLWLSLPRRGKRGT
eukprot:394617-Alexandrium_andersonii.AAC.1